MRWSFMSGVVLALAASAALAASEFPELTGRVVDNAHLLSPAVQQQLTQQLETLEAQTSDQLVVVTVPDLRGAPIEDYGYKLGRQWGIGQKGKNNGALLIVAPKEHKVRIEVGYGLEGTLTDAQSSVIIQSIMLPQFKQGRVEQGIVSGVAAITQVLAGKPLEVAPPQVVTSVHSGGSGGIILFIFVLILFSQVVLFAFYAVGWILGGILALIGLPGLANYMTRMRTRIYPADRALLFWLLTPSMRIGGSGSSFGGDSGGGFSGGGGSFGGGGSSGSW